MRLVTALAVEQSEEWLTGRRYLNMEELREHRRSEDSGAQEVMLVERYILESESRLNIPFVSGVWGR